MAELDDFVAANTTRASSSGLDAFVAREQRTTSGLDAFIAKERGIDFNRPDRLPFEDMGPTPSFLTPEPEIADPTALLPTPPPRTSSLLPPAGASLLSRGVPFQDPLRSTGPTIGPVTAGSKTLTPEQFEREFIPSGPTLQSTVGRTEFGKTEFGKGVVRGGENVLSGVVNLVALAADTLGKKQVAENIQFKSRIRQREIGKQAQAKITSFKDIESVSDFGNYTLSTLGQLTPYLIAVANGQALLGRVGLFATTGGIETGNTYAEITERTGSTDNKVLSVATGAAIGGLEGIAGISALKRLGLFNKAKGVAVKKLMNDPVWKTTVRGLVTQAGVEGSTEMGQEILQVTANYIASEGEEVFGKEFWKEIVERVPEAGVAGALGGGIIGGAGGLATSVSAKPAQGPIQPPETTRPGEVVRAAPIDIAAPAPPQAPPEAVGVVPAQQRVEAEAIVAQPLGVSQPPVSETQVDLSVTDETQLPIPPTVTPVQAPAPKPPAQEPIPAKPEGEVAKVPTAPSVSVAKQPVKAQAPQVVTPTVVAPPIKPVAKPEVPKVTAAKEEFIARDREALGLNELDSPERRTWKKALLSAKEQNIPDRALRLAAEINETDRSLSVEETAGMVIKAAGLKNEHKRLTVNMDKFSEPADIQFAASERSRVQAEFDALTRALKLSGAEAGRRLVAQKLTINDDFDLISVENSAKASKGKNLTSKERARFESMTKELETLTGRVDTLETQAKERVARVAITASKKRGRNAKLTKAAKDSELNDLYGKLNGLLAAGCDDRG